MRTLLAITVGKLISSATRSLKIGGGSAAPGLYALKLDPNLVEKLVKKIPKNIIITGTNGKTTTSRMITHFGKDAGLKVIKNHTGSNMERGIASTLIQNHGSKFDLGVWELDEATFNDVALKINPNIIVFLNVSRDQLDRYGEIDKVVNMWSETLSKLDPKTVVLINDDDPDLDKLEKYFKGKVVKFGKKDLQKIKTKGLDGSSFELKILNSELKINLPLPGLYHIYDAVAALICAYHLNLPIQKLSNSLTNFQPAFGRFEKLPFGYIFLIKNPVGATQVFQTIAPQIKPQDRLLLALNDNLADGTDVSWIWDAEFEVLQNSSRAKSRNLSLYVSGTRAYDLAVRLKYAGFDTKDITIQEDIGNALKQARKGLKGTLFILPTYTAMLELQGILAKSGIKKNYWESD